MWIFRTLLLLAEYGGLFISIVGAVAAYLLNLNRADLPKKSHLPFKQIWLKNWIEFRKKQEHKSAFFDFFTSAMTIAAAATFVPLISKLPGLGREMWYGAIANYHYETIRIGVMVFLFALAWILFVVRKHFPRLYAFFEIAIGLAMAWDALGFLQAAQVSDGEAGAYWAGKVFSPNALRVMAAVYVIIRGLVNWNEKSDSTLLQRSNPQAATPGTAVSVATPAPTPVATNTSAGKQKGKKNKS